MTSPGPSGGDGGGVWAGAKRVQASTPATASTAIEAPMTYIGRMANLLCRASGRALGNAPSLCFGSRLLRRDPKGRPSPRNGRGPGQTLQRGLLIPFRDWRAREIGSATADCGQIA